MNSDEIDNYKLIDKKKRKSIRIKKKRDERKKKWYDPKINTNIYISGLPLNFTREKLVKMFSKAGVIRMDISTEMEKVKLYTDKETGKFKGDALISYENIESVELSITLFNNREIEKGHIISVEKAKFEQKGHYKERQTSKIDEIAKLKYKAYKEKTLSWDNNNVDLGLKILIIKYMFKESDYINEDKNTFFECLKNDIMDEFTQKFGEINNIWIYEDSVEGAVKVKFKNSQSAADCLNSINGRMYNGNKLLVEYWDGRTSYNDPNKEWISDEKRIEEFGKWLFEDIKKEIRK